jgi:hypothetical protein
MTVSQLTLKDPAAAVPAARNLMLSGIWRSSPKTGDALDKALYALRIHTPAALAVLPRSAVAALTRPPPAGGCSWCTATLWAAASLGADPPPPVDDHTRAFLGSQCGRCRRRHLAAEAARRERGHVAGLLAAGLYPSAARRLRTPEQVAAHAQAAREYGQYTRAVLAAATSPGRRRDGDGPTPAGTMPTGLIWIPGRR